MLGENSSEETFLEYWFARDNQEKFGTQATLWSYFNQKES
jgi:hypothetical protein